MRRPYIKPPRSEDCEWRSGPPPEIGWWPADYAAKQCKPCPSVLRWWDGVTWSCVALDSDSPKFAGLVASTRTGHADRDIRWTDRWWEDEHMSPLVAIQYLRRRAAISAGTNSGATTREATVLLLIADLIQQLESENAELRRALKLSGQVMRNSIGEDEK
jgi:hypothetical protein